MPTIENVSLVRLIYIL